MDTDSDNDFTFCQDGPETKKLASDISDISIKEESSNASSNSHNSGFLWKDGLPNDSNSKKEGTVGSLSFSVINTASNQPSQLSTKSVPSDAKNSPQKSPEQKNSVKKPTVRAKVPFEKGYSQMDWLKLTQSHPDLAGLKGQSNRRLISIDEVRKNQTEGQMWTVLKGRVYNISPYMKFHPGGLVVALSLIPVSDKYHAWVNAEFLLEKCLVGTLDDSQ
ncbi:Cytochrome b5-like heme/steroid binding domain [Sesbania bispinosa]|nr:Cytochrome b5-like heme/steroid binding domain [Sesbania bispinosa]